MMTMADITENDEDITENDEDIALSLHGQLLDIEEKLERLIDRAKHYGEHSGAVEVFEEILVEVKTVIEHEERYDL